MSNQPKYETERKFLVRGSPWSEATQSRSMVQGYLTTDPDKTIRVRIDGDIAVLTVKGATDGDRRIECESQLVDSEAARTMLACFSVGTRVEKRRHLIEVAGNVWEVDEFLADNAGLVVAELEAPDGTTPEQAESFFAEALSTGKRPTWLGPEVTTDWRYANSQLSERPFSSWTDDERADMASLS